MPTTIEPPSVIPGRTTRLDDTDGRGHGDAVRVIVLNDHHNTFDHVAATLARYVPGVTIERGYALADRVHHAGQAIVWSGVREVAELYHEQLSGAGLTMAPLD